MLKKLKTQGITILVSTPYMDEANLCDRIALIQNGKIMSIDSPANIIAAYPSKLYGVKADNIYKLLNDLRANELVESSYPFGEYLHVTLKGQRIKCRRIKKLWNSKKVTPILKLNRSRPALKTVLSA